MTGSELTPPPLDMAVGMGRYSTTYEGSGGRIRAKPGDFAVCEILSDAALRSIREAGTYAVYELAKEGIDTGHCISDAYRRARIRLKAMGLKDAAARTTQHVCASSRGPGIPRLDAPRYTLRRLGYVERPLTGRSMTGNRFDIVVRGGAGLEGSSLEDSILNYYGYQRFGSRRPVTHLVGRAVLHNDMAEAIRLILSETSPFDSPESNELRSMMADPSRHAECLRMMPRSMDTERTVLSSLSDGDDHRAAFLRIPLYLRRLYVQAYQSYVFNLTLTAAASGGYDLSTAHEGDVCFDRADQLGRYGESEGQRLAVPMVGYSYYKKTRFHEVVSEVLDGEGVAPRDFYVRHMQEVSSEGGFRQATLECSDVDILRDRIRLTLSRGSFATVALREVMKPADPVAAGF